LNGLRADVSRESDYYNRTVLPYLQQNADLTHFYTRESLRPGFPDETYSYAGLAPSAVNPQIDLIKRRQFRNILLHRLTTLINVLYWQDSELDERLERIMQMIDQQIGAQ